MNHKLKLIIAVFVLMLVTLACSFSVSTANISDAWMAFDSAGNQRTTVFGPQDIFYCIVQLENAPDDTTVKVVWIAAQVEGSEPGAQLFTSELTTGDNQLQFELNNDNLWPVGSYQAEIYLNDELDRTLEFAVQATGDPPPPTEAPVLQPTEPSAPVVYSAFLSFDDAGVETTTVFGPNDTFYLQVAIANAPNDTHYKASWYAVQAEGIEPNYLINEADITGGDGPYTFNLSPNQPWPAGIYRVDLYINGELSLSIEFDVVPDDGGPSLTQAYMSLDEAGSQPTTVYGQSDIFYARVEMVNSPRDTTLTAVWYAVDAEGVEANFEIEMVEITGGDDVYTFNLSNDDLWPLGMYQVEIYLDGVLNAVLEFAVQ